MKFIRSKLTWIAVETFSGEVYCLERLALSKCYRVADVCAALGCSQRYLHAAFLRDIGLPPKTWMNLERMVVARRMLDGGKSIEQVASDLGFMSLEAFRKRFYKMYRLSPGRYVRSRRIFDPSKPLPRKPAGRSPGKPRGGDSSPGEEP